MLQITAFSCDYLSLKSTDPKYYHEFIKKYTLLTVPIIYSQAILTPDPAVGLTEETLDNDVNQFINHLPDNAANRRDYYRIFRQAAGIDLGEIIQDEEEREFVNQFFEETSDRLGLSNRKLVLSLLNASAFLNYFSLLEDTLKKIYFKINKPQEENERKTGGHTISFYLKKILYLKNIENDFIFELERRSKFFNNFSTLVEMWRLMNLIRNQYIHNGNYYDEESKKKFNKAINDVISKISGNQYNFEKVLFRDKFKPMIKEIKETSQLTFSDILENCIRNICLFVIESLLLCDRKSENETC